MDASSSEAQLLPPPLLPLPLQRSRAPCSHRRLRRPRLCPTRGIHGSCLKITQRNPAAEATVWAGRAEPSPAAARAPADGSCVFFSTPSLPLNLSTLFYLSFAAGRRTKPVPEASHALRRSRRLQTQTSQASPFSPAAARSWRAGAREADVGPRRWPISAVGLHNPRPWIWPLRNARTLTSRARISLRIALHWEVISMHFGFLLFWGVVFF